MKPDRLQNALSRIFFSNKTFLALAPNKCMFNYITANKNISATE